MSNETDRTTTETDSSRQVEAVASDPDIRDVGTDFHSHARGGEPGPPVPPEGGIVNRGGL